MSLRSHCLHFPCLSRFTECLSILRKKQSRCCRINTSKLYDGNKQFYSCFPTRNARSKSMVFSPQINHSQPAHELSFRDNLSWFQFRNRIRKQYRFQHLTTLTKPQLIKNLEHSNDFPSIERSGYSKEVDEYWGIDFSSDSPPKVIDESLRNKTVVVGVSGGVDSSVSALLLKEKGFKNVVGVFMRNWDPQDESGEIDACSISEDFKVAEKVCQQLNIPFYEATFINQYWTEVFEPYLEMLKSGGTPNPDVFCNREIKFKAFFHYVNQKFGSDALIATGHYARLGKSKTDMKPLLLQAVDSTKDQTYFLCGVGNRALSRVIFPVGSLHKSQVRALAKTHDLCTAARKDSVGICFVGKRKFGDFIGNYLDESPGKIINVDNDAESFGYHSGLFRYTIGQGAKVPGLKEKLFVAGKDKKTNTLLVCEGETNPALFSKGLYVDPTFMYWVDGVPPKDLFHTGSLRLKCKVRYRQAAVWCTIHFENMSTERERLIVVFDEPEKAITPMQVVAFYRGNVCLGGGLIGGCVEPG